MQAVLICPPADSGRVETSVSCSVPGPLQKHADFSTCSGSTSADSNALSGCEDETEVEIPLQRAASSRFRLNMEPYDGSSPSSPTGKVRFDSPSSTKRKVSCDSPSSPTRKVSFDSRLLVTDHVNTFAASRYDIERRELGIGGYGKVYRAKDKMFKDRQVAIKKVKKWMPSYGAGEVEDLGNALQREVEIMKHLDHPSICRLFEIYEEEESIFFVLECCEGGDLCTRLMECGWFAEPVVAEIVKQVSGALNYAHSRGVAHRDLKMENICVYSQNTQVINVKVIDWGLGKFFEHNQMRSSVGNLIYVAPEVLDPPESGKGYTSACDLWSLGVIAYVALCGQPPFAGSITTQLKKMKNEEFSFEGKRWERISSDAKSFIKALIRSDSNDRATASEAMSHPWLTSFDASPDWNDVTEALRHVEQFRHTSDIFSLCSASIARQADHRSLERVHDVFCMLDKNHDGFLDMEELRAGFEGAFGGTSQVARETEDIFHRTDLDNSGQIGYTEFCAAALGQHSVCPQHMLWAAFKTFDVKDDGKITLQELHQVLRNAGLKRSNTEGCMDVAREVMQEFGRTDGDISFKDWARVFQQKADGAA